ncbi:MAG: hypothetical protein R3F43_06005 [bacterium]
MAAQIWAFQHGRHHGHARRDQQKLTNAIDNLFTLSVVTVVCDSELKPEIKTE